MFVPTQTTNRPAFGWRFLHGLRDRNPRRRGGLEGLPFRFPRRRGGLECADCARKGMGCANCKRMLGDTYDPVTGTYVPSLPGQDNPVSLPLAPSQAAFNANPYAYSGIVAGGAAGDSPANQAAAWGYNPSSVPTISSSGGISPALLMLPSVGAPTVAAAPVSSLSSYLPYIALGLGGLVLISAVKRK